MSIDTYTLEDLQRLEERCVEKAGKLGLEVPTIMFHLVQAEEMYDIAARHLPGRYSHYQFGREYERQKGDYDKGRARIYELVINTRPVNAYLLDGNSVIAQLFVIAHVTGHATVYEHNKYFGPADKNILSRTRAAAERIDKYIGEYGRERVEDFIDACEALQYQRHFAQLGKRPSAKSPEWEIKDFDVLFPSETEARRKEYQDEREAFKYRFPKEPVRDLLAFFEEHSRFLEDWQKDIISIIRMEMDYFTPSMHTNILHEAQAVYYHNKIVHELMAEDPLFTTDHFTEFQSMNARVLHPKIAQVYNGGAEDGRHWQGPRYDGDEPYVACTGVNPYLTGYAALYSEVKRICENPTKEERERWDWAGNITWDEKRCELVKVYSDAALLAEFCSPAFCEKAHLFMRPRTIAEYKKLRVLEEEAEQVRKELVEGKTTFGIPVVEITNADHKHRGELYLEHRDQGIGLDDEYVRGTLPYLRDLWGHAVTVKTVYKDEKTEKVRDKWYRIKPGSDVSDYTVEPS